MRQINLLPEHLQKDQDQKVIFSSLLIGFGLTLLLIFLLHGLLMLGISNLKNKISRPSSYTDTVEFIQMRDQIRAVDDEMKEYAGQYGALIEAYINNYSTIDILSILGKNSKHKVWLTRLALNNTSRNCEIEGRSFNTRLVSEFMLTIKKSPFFDSVSLISIEKNADEKVDFKIVCTLK